MKMSKVSNLNQITEMMKIRESTDKIVNSKITNKKMINYSSLNKLIYDVFFQFAEK